MVKRAFVASQANRVGFMKGGVKTHYPAENKHGRLGSALLFFIVHINTVLRNFVAKKVALYALLVCKNFWSKNWVV